MNWWKRPGGNVIRTPEGIATDRACCCGSAPPANCLECVDLFPDTLEATLYVIGDTDPDDCTCAHLATVLLTKREIGEQSVICDGLGFTDDTLPRWDGTKTICGSPFPVCLVPCGTPPPGPSACVGAEFPMSLYVPLESSEACIDPADCLPVVIPFEMPLAVLTDLCGATTGELLIIVEPPVP